MNLQRTRPERTPPASRPAAVLTVLAAAQPTVTLATSIVNVALPRIRTAADLSDSGTTRVVNAHGLAFGTSTHPAPVSRTPSTPSTPSTPRIPRTG
ncbi:hypothetical protein ACIGXM_21965 [Kitasatospora sp. NPDC052896]|uniref:hypothetical protein n=1 Tax=Kitasatospora sp. NPDC052896 TaxID=3364061 RepID=UPI0037C7DBD3